MTTDKAGFEIYLRAGSGSEVNLKTGFGNLKKLKSYNSIMAKKKTTKKTSAKPTPGRLRQELRRTDRELVQLLRQHIETAQQLAQRSAAPLRLRSGCFFRHS